jgi:(p)ppGpp synthase/HD superfamily hydrolase
MDAIGLLLDALQFSAEKHRVQKRKDGDTAYINQPIAVARTRTEVKHES